ncbi:MAG: translocation/assembly module TamB domain-containing protein, partial [Flavobacteriales bacterium]
SLQFKFKYQNSSILSNINIVTLALHKDIKYRDVSFEGFGTKDSIVVKVSNDNNSKPKFKSNISFTGALLSPTSVKLIFDSSYVVLADSVWVLNSENLVEWDSSRWAFKNFNLVSNLKKINLSGAISKDTSDQLDIFISGLNLGNFAKIAEVKEAQLKGNVTGVISLAKLYYRPDISSTIYVNDLYANNEYVGSGPLYSSWNSDLERFDVNFDLFRPADSAFIDTIRSLKFYGHYYPQVEDTSFQLKLLTDGFKIKAIEPIVKEYLDNISGELVGEIDLSGSFSNPIINGKIRLDSTSFRIVYLNTNYYFNNQYLIFEDDWFGYNDLLFQDENGSEAHSIGTVNHSNWKNFDYDLYVKANNFLCLNTNAKQNELFYGKAFISGDVNIAGYEDHLNIEMDARTQNNSKLFVPLYAADEVSSNHFIHFVNVETDSEEDHLKKHNTDLSGIDMKFNFDNIISKRFTIQQGGKIDFNGDPLNARTDIVAQYKVKTGLQEILGDSAYSQKVENLCLMHLTDHLSDPNISFDIKVLNVDAEIESRVRNQMPTQEDVNMQVFSLMLFNKYSPPENSLSGSGFAGTTTSELLTSQINSWLGKMDNRVVKVGVSELKQDNVEVQLSKEMLNNRLVFESNLGVDNSQTNTNQGESEQLVGDFKLEYMVRKDGKVRAKVFNRSETYRIEDQGNSASQTQGIGIFFQEEFEFYGQLLKRYFNNPVRKKERKEKKMLK